MIVRDLVENWRMKTRRHVAISIILETTTCLLVFHETPNVEKLLKASEIPVCLREEGEAKKSYIHCLNFS